VIFRDYGIKQPESSCVCESKLVATNRLGMNSWIVLSTHAKTIYQPD